MKILVTGANGFLGANVVRELLKRDADVRALVRKSSNLNPLEGLSIQKHFGNITSLEDVEEAVAGCSAVIHIAAMTSQKHTNLKSYFEANINATKNIIDAAKKYNINRIIYVSSAAVIGYGSKDNPGSEANEIRYPFNMMPYPKSKHVAQKLMLKAAKELQTEVIVVNPTFMIGAYDSKPSSGQIILMAVGKRFVLVPPGGKNFIHVKDAAIGICNALTQGKNGECYLLSNQNLSFREFFSLVNGFSNKRSVFIAIPKSILLFLGLIGSLIAKTSINVSLNYYNAVSLCVSNFYSNKKSVKELSMPTTPIESAISESVEWFTENGYLPKVS